VGATERQACAHLQLGTVHGLIGRVVDESNWSKYIVPGNNYIAALKSKCGLLENEDVGGPCLTYMSADRLSLGIKAATSN
jgi:hypothetical protein